MNRDRTIAKLGAAGAEPSLAAGLQTFGQFIGAWDLEWHGKDTEGNAISVPGELYIGWILDGRAIQDIWRVPVDPRLARHMRAFHGTTVRFYDPAIGAWRSTWIDPLNGRVRRFIGRVIGDSIVLDGLDDDPRERWSFNDITRDSFVWRGEWSPDGGATWTLDDEMYATRRTRS